MGESFFQTWKFHIWWKLISILIRLRANSQYSSISWWHTAAGCRWTSDGYDRLPLAQQWPTTVCCQHYAPIVIIIMLVIILSWIWPLDWSNTMSNFMRVNKIEFPHLGTALANSCQDHRWRYCLTENKSMFRYICRTFCSQCYIIEYVHLYLDVVVGNLNQTPSVSA